MTNKSTDYSTALHCGYTLATQNIKIKGNHLWKTSGLIVWNITTFHQTNYPEIPICIKKCQRQHYFQTPRQISNWREMFSRLIYFQHLNGFSQKLNAGL